MYGKKFKKSIFKYTRPNSLILCQAKESYVWMLFIHPALFHPPKNADRCRKQLLKKNII